MCIASTPATAGSRTSSPRRLLCLLAVAAIGSAASAQNAVPLPSAPAPQASSSAAPAPVPEGTGSISGTVLSQAGAEVPGARVVLDNNAGGGQREVRANSSGEFTFNGLPAGTFRITASSPDWGSYVSPPIHLDAGGFQLVTGVVLPVTTSTSVRVYATPDALAEQQVQIAEQQRVLRVFPNFYSSYDWNAPPMHSRQKFKLAFRSLIDPLTFLDAAGIAGAEQYVNRFPGYGTGGTGFLERYGAAYADAWSGRMFSEAIYPSVFHQDPRYFYRGTGSIPSRALYAISAAVVARGDDGQREPSYSRIFGSFTAAAVSNLYYPPSERGGSLVWSNGLIGIAGDAGANLVREFVLKKLTTRGEERDH